MNKYICEMCKGEFQSDVSEEDKLAEVKQNFGEIPEPEGRVSVCEDCYREVMKQMAEWN